MVVKKAACIPLVLHDPYFSIWSKNDHLYDGDPVHWSGARQKLRGYVTVDNVTYGFLGDREFHAPIEQKKIEVTATATVYHFENEKIKLEVRFTTPLLLEDLKLVSRPCTYVDFAVEKKADCIVDIFFFASSDLVSQDGGPLVGYTGRSPKKDGKTGFSYASMGRAFQRPLGGSGDRLTIDWGYVYLASADAEPAYDAANGRLGVTLSLDGQNKAGLILAYDDMISINYFGQWRKAYWTKEYADILEAVRGALEDKARVCIRAEALDTEIEERARRLGGDAYVYLCNMSYRHSIAAHKLIEDDAGNVVFLSKENDSNGCIGTVDVSYPSVPLYLLYNTELVKGMLRPVFQFAASDVWEYDFAPHDVGRYPYAWGQVYGLNGALGGICYDGSNGAVFPPYYQYPAGSGIYDVVYQMPVEECGNMLLMTAAVCMLDNSAEFAAPYMDTLKKWTEYLLEYGADPGNQLCTDDFAGHLSHNVNLSAKAIMGIEAYARLADQLGRKEEACGYHEKAKEMAKGWEERAFLDDHYALAFGENESWSLKYNLIWDRFFGSGLFSEEVYQRELAYYVRKANTFGTPLDGRRSYTKSDWILWCAAMAGSTEQVSSLITPVAQYLENTSSRVPFSDWYDTETGEFCAFMGRSVQGGIFMPMLIYNENTAPLKTSPLKDKKLLFLGSSVTCGSAAGGVSMADHIRGLDGCRVVKEAVRGTTLADRSPDSYVSRLKRVDTDQDFDAVICQLSTNDASQRIPLGTVGNSGDTFETDTVAGAMEAIIAYVQDTWNCPIVFYTNTKFDSPEYQAMVDILPLLKAKWGIHILDLWNDDEMNNVGADKYALYMSDAIHPTRAGYLRWWTPKFQACLYELIGES